MSENNELERARETARALEIVLSRIRVDSGTAHVLRGNLANQREVVERLSAKQAEENPANG